MKLEEIEEICNNATPAPWAGAAREYMSKLIAVAITAKEVCNIEHLSLDPRFDARNCYRSLEKALEELEKE